MRIDVHAHYFPAEYVDLLVQLGRQDLKFAGRQSNDFSARIAELDEAKIDTQILSAVGLDTEIQNCEGAITAARFINDVYRDVTEKHHKRFRAFGWVPLPYVDAAIDEARRCLDELRFEGIAVACSAQQRPLDDKEFEPFWAELDRRSAIIYVHPVGTHSTCHWGMKEFGLHTAFGSPVQLQIAATRLVYSGLTRRYPKLKFIFAVCGGYLPYWWTRMERNLRRGIEMSATAAVGANYFAWVKDLGLDAKDPMAEFRKFYYDTSVQDIPEAMLCAKRAYGVDRMLLGSDAIFASATEIVSYIESNEYLTAAEKHAILDENAQKLFNFPSR